MLNLACREGGGCSLASVDDDGVVRLHSFKFESSRNSGRLVHLVAVHSRSKIMWQTWRNLSRDTLEETPAMTKKSPEREISIKASVVEAGATFRGNVELLTQS